MRESQDAGGSGEDRRHRTRWIGAGFSVRLLGGCGTRGVIGSLVWMAESGREGAIAELEARAKGRAVNALDHPVRTAAPTTRAPA